MLKIGIDERRMSHPIAKLQFDGGDIGNVGEAAHLEFRKEFLLWAVGQIVPFSSQFRSA